MQQNESTERELVVIKQQVTRLGNEVEEVRITNQQEHTEAIDIRARLKTQGSIIKNTKESITKPLNDALRNVRLMFNPIEDRYAEAVEMLDKKILGYAREVQEKARIEEQKIAARLEAGRLKPETAEKKIDNIVRVENTTRGEVGKVTIRKNKKIRIVNESAIPRKYLVPDLVAIRKDAIENGIAVDGVEVYIEETIV